MRYKKPKTKEITLMTVKISIKRKFKKDELSMVFKRFKICFHTYLVHWSILFVKLVPNVVHPRWLFLFLRSFCNQLQHLPWQAFPIVQTNKSSSLFTLEYKPYNLNPIPNSIETRRDPTTAADNSTWQIFHFNLISNGGSNIYLCHKVTDHSISHTWTKSN